MHIRAVDLAEVRTSLVGQRDRIGPEALAFLHQEDQLGRVFNLSPKEIAIRETTKLAYGDLYFVSEEMTELSLAASRTMPLFDADAQDFPSETGAAYFDGGVAALWGDHRVAIHLITWQVLTMGAAVAVYIDVSSTQGIFKDLESWNESLRQLRSVGGSEGGLWFNDITRGLIGFHPEEALQDEEAERLIRDRYTVSTTAFLLLRSALLLMQQPLALVEDAQYDRAARRRMQKLGQDPPRVRVISLRRSATGSSDGESDREYHHRWIVKGHWRKQWYPSREVHRPVWIAPHVKGPDDKPFIGGEKVYSWTK